MMLTSRPLLGNFLPGINGENDSSKGSPKAAVVCYVAMSVLYSTLVIIKKHNSSRITTMDMD